MSVECWFCFSIDFNKVNFCGVFCGNFCKNGCEVVVRVILRSLKVDDDW